jgi:protein TonB
VAIGQSSLSQLIPGVEEGAFTALNTDQLEFYAFYQRANEQIRNRWVGLIRDYLGELAARDMEILARRNRTTQIEVVLNPSGEYVRSVVHTGSCDKGLDQAAGESFRRAAPFPNPPSEMVKADGFIHLFYAFTLYLRPPNFGPAVN